MYGAGTALVGGIGISTAALTQDRRPLITLLIFVDPSGKYSVVIYDSYPYEENTTKDI